ncbi:MAG: translation initiation factor IF-2 [Acidobacteria bacterium]|nr:translation initiation factor IF-2 [Acidobacteriota bacterium]
MTLRINQLAKDLGVSNHDVIDVLEKRLGVTGKSHSSNLSQDQEAQIRRVLEAKAKGQPEAAPLAVHKPHAAIKVVKAPRGPEGPEAPKAEAVAPRLEAPKPEPVKAEAPKAEPKPEPKVEAPKVEVPKVEAPKPPTVLIKKAEAPAAPAPAPAPEAAPAPAPAQGESFSRLRVSQAPSQAAKPEEKPARYIQLPQARPPQAASGPRPEAGARAVLQRPGTHTTPSHVQRSGVPQPKAVLPMASNTSRGEVKHEAPKPAVTSSRMSNLPSISQLQPDQGFSRLKMSDTPPPEPREQGPARYIQLPQARPAGGPSRPSGPGGRPGGPGRGPGGPGGPRPGGFGGPRPGGPGGPNRGPGGPRPGGFGSRPGGPGGRPGLGAPAGPIDPNSQKGPGRGPSGGKKKGKHERTEEEELAIKMRQPRSRAQVIATEYIEDEIGIVMLSEGVTVKELAEKCNRPAKDVVAKLLHRGIFATINQPLDTELAKEIAREFGFLADIVSFEEDVQMMDEATEVQGEKRPRPPVVTIMGHVDHGKTSLLDAIRSAKVAAGEAGGITQHIGAYHVDVKDKNTGLMRTVVFLDTPGHEAFTKMRARGAKVTDIAILVVAADDGVMPQTVESINHAKAADVPLVVAINKIDKAGANPDKVQQGLLQHSVQTEAYGGDVPAVPVSAKSKQGLDELLETLLLVADMKDLKAVYDCPAAGSIIEARLDKGRGAVATVLVQNGTLRAGEIFVAGATMGRVRAMFDDRGNRITEAGPSTAVQILGFEEVPSSGDNFQVVESEGKARTIAQFRQEKLKAAALAKQRVTLENIFSTMKEGSIKELPLIIKADTQGSVESLVGSLEKLSTDKVRVRIIHAAAGTVNENDVLLAEASKAIVIAFHTKAEKKAEELAKEEGVDLRFHDIIYKVSEEIEQAMIGKLDSLDREVYQGRAEVLQIFKAGKTVIAGSRVTDGFIKKNAKVRVKRGEDQIFEGLISALKRFKDDVTEVKNGFECGISLQNFDDLREGDTLEFHTTEKYAQTSL